MSDVPPFRLQIVDRSGRVVVSPFVAGPLEIDLINRCIDATLARGVGLFKTTAQVREAMREGMTEAIQALKEETRPIATRYR